MEKIYIADDGKKFNEYNECLLYEYSLLKKENSKIRIKNGQMAAEQDDIMHNANNTFDTNHILGSKEVLDDIYNIKIYRCNLRQKDNTYKSYDFIVHSTSNRKDLVEMACYDMFGNPYSLENNQADPKYLRNDWYITEPYKFEKSIKQNDKISVTYKSDAKQLYAINKLAESLKKHPNKKVIIIETNDVSPIFAYFNENNKLSSSFEIWSY